MCTGVCAVTVCKECEVESFYKEEIKKKKMYAYLEVI